MTIYFIKYFVFVLSEIHFDLKKKRRMLYNPLPLHSPVTYLAVCYKQTYIYML